MSDIFLLTILGTMISFLLGLLVGYAIGTRAEEAKFWAAYHAVLREKGEQ